jgi:hypothetical protein
VRLVEPNRDLISDPKRPCLSLVDGGYNCAGWSVEILDLLPLVDYLGSSQRRQIYQLWGMKLAGAPLDGVFGVHTVL